MILTYFFQPKKMILLTKKGIFTVFIF